MVRTFVRERGDAEALVRDGERCTFRQLDERSALIAKALLARGATKGSRIALLAPPGPNFALCVLAVGRIGAIVCPLSTLYQPPELQWVLAAGEFEHLIMVDSFLGHDYVARLERALPGLVEQDSSSLFLEAAPRLRCIHVIGTQQPRWSQPFSDLLVGDARISDQLLIQVEDLVRPSDPACIIYTSGSTAHPKGVVHAHGPLIRHSWQMGLEFTPFRTGDRIILTRPMFWVAGFVAALFYTLNNGACLISTSDGSPGNVLRLIREERANALSGDPGWFDVLRESAELHAAGYDVIRLNMDSAGIARDGAYLNLQLAERHGRAKREPNARFARTFGMTETLGGHTSLRNGELLPEDRPGWQGRAVPGVEIKIVDVATQQPVPAGVVGELYLRGYCLMLGIDGRERHATFDADGYYATGDLCMLDAGGLLKFEARRGEMIKVHGANVAPLEVELALTGLMGIEKAGVVGVLNDEEMTLTAAVLMAAGRTLNEAAIIADLKTKLSSYKVPKRIIALSADQLPTTGSGKIKKAELIALLKALSSS